MMIKKKYSRHLISIELIKTRKHHLQACHREGKAMFKSHAGASLTVSMFIKLLISLNLLFYFIIYLLIKLSLTFIFHFISFNSHFNIFNKIDILIFNVDQYGNMDWECVDEFAYCKYTFTHQSRFKIIESKSTMWLSEWLRERRLS